MSVTASTTSARVEGPPEVYMPLLIFALRPVLASPSHMAIVAKANVRDALQRYSRRWCPLWRPHDEMIWDITCKCMGGTVAYEYCMISRITI